MVDIFMKPAMSKVHCEDWIEKASWEHAQWIGISDGCSSSKDTHLGSFNMVQNAMIKDYMESIPICKQEGDYGRICRDAYDTSPYIESERNMDATLLILLVDKEYIHLNMCGDGVYFYKRKDSDSIFIHEFEFDNNMPLYPSYFMNEEIKKKRESYNICLHENRYVLCDSSISSDGQGYYPDTCLHKRFDKADLDFFGIASDGIASFNKMKQWDVYKDFFRFKGAGEFVKRVAVHTFKDYYKKGIFNSDDFSMGVWKRDN